MAVETNSAVRRAVDRAVYWSVYGGVDANVDGDVRVDVDNVVRRAVNEAVHVNVNWAVFWSVEGNPHPGLQDFLLEARGGWSLRSELTNFTVYRTVFSVVYWAVDANVDEAAWRTVRVAVWQAVWRTVRVAEWQAVHNAMYEAVDEESSHPGLQDFLFEVGVEA
jgi:hypothetical protein